MKQRVGCGRRSGQLRSWELYSTPEPTNAETCSDFPTIQASDSFGSSTFCSRCSIHDINHYNHDTQPETELREHSQVSFISLSKSYLHNDHKEKKKKNGN